MPSEIKNKDEETNLPDDGIIGETGHTTANNDSDCHGDNNNNRNGKKGDNYYMSGGQLIYEAFSAWIKTFKIWDLVIPRDHRLSFRYSYLKALAFTSSSSKSPGRIKQHMIRMSEIWIMAYGLLLSIQSTLWTAFPQEATPWQKIFFHCVSYLTALLFIASVAIFAPLAVITSTVHTKNIRAYSWASLGMYHIAEFLLVGGLYGFIGQLFMYSYTQFSIILQEDFDNEHYQLLALAPSIAPLLVILAMTVNPVNVSAAIAQNGCLMSHKAVVPSNETNEAKIIRKVTANMKKYCTDERILSYYLETLNEDDVCPTTERTSVRPSE